MKKQKFLLPIFLLLFTLSSCVDDDGFFGDCTKGDGPVVEQVITLSDFKGIDVKSSVDVFITQGAEFEVIAKGEQNIIDLLETDVKNDEWEIEFDECVKDFKLELFITMPEIEYLGISGSGSITGDNFFEVDDITLRISGSGDICLGLFADIIDARISGSGEIDLEGEADEMDFRISGSGDLSAFPMEVKEVDLSISGSGDASVFATEFLKVKISGSGDVFYKGEPELDLDISGSGDVIDAN